MPVAHLDLYRLAALDGEDPALLDDYARRATASRSSSGPSVAGAELGDARRRAGALEHARRRPPADHRSDDRASAFDTATPATVVAARRRRADRAAPRRRPTASAPATRPSCWRCAPRRSTRPAGGWAPTSTASASASGRARSPACGSASRRRARSRRRRARELVAVSTLEALAAARPTPTPSASWPCLDARRGEAFTRRLARRRAAPCAARATRARRASAALGRRPGRGWRSATGRYAFATELEPAGARSRRGRPPRCTACSALRACAGWRAAAPAASTATRSLPRLRAGARRAGTRRAEPAAPMSASVPNLEDIRRLTYADLPQVIAIERRAFPTPWSLAMFVLELSKPGGVCLAAARDGAARRLPVCSRYDDGLAPDERRVDPDVRRTGIGDGAARAAARARSATRGALHARGPHLQRQRDRALRALRLPLRRHAPPLLPGQRRGRADHVAHAGDAERHARRRARTPGSGRGDPRDRDELRRHLRRRRHRDGGDRARTSSPPRASTTATAASCPRSPRATTSS